MKRPPKVDLDAFQNDLDTLRLAFIREHHEDFIRRAAKQQWDHQALLARLIQGEAALRRERSIARRIRLARFPVKKTLDGSTGPGPKKSTANRSCTCSGCGSWRRPAMSCSSAASAWARTHLAIALGLRACQARYPVLFASAIDAVNTLAAAQATGPLKPALKPLPQTPRSHIGRTGVPAHRQNRRRPAVPDPQPALRARLHRHHHQSRVSQMARNLQQRRHPHLRRTRPPAAPRRNRRHRGQELPNERSQHRLVIEAANTLANTYNFKMTNLVQLHAVASNV